MINYKKLKNLLIWKCKQRNVGRQLPTATRMAEQKDVDVPAVLLPCTSCGRTFRPEVLVKHSKVCEKTLMKKRKIFDSSKQRLQGTELEAYANVPPTNKSKNKDTSTVTTKTSPAKWKEKQGDLAKTLQAVRKSLDNTPLKNTNVKPSDHQQCPFCERYFGPKAYGRHVDWCKGQQFRVKPNNTNNEARERLQVRTGYRAPLPNKMLTRDKYQPGGRRSRDSSLSKSESTTPKLSEPVSRSQTFSISKSPVKPIISDRKVSNTKPKNIIDSPRKSRKNYEETETSSDVLKTNLLPKIMSTTTSRKNDIDKYDPFASAEQQMLELFDAGLQRETTNNCKNSNIVNNNIDKKINKGHTTFLPDPDPIIQELVKSTTPTKSSPPPPLSAFALYSRRTVSSENLTLDNQENSNEDDDSISSPLPALDKQLDDIDKQFIFNNLESCSVVSIDSITDYNKNNQIITGKYYRSNSENTTQKQRSPVGDIGGGMKTNSAGTGSRISNKKVNMQQMLFGNSPSPQTPSNINITDTSADINAETVGLLEECEVELMLELEKMFNTPPKTISPLSLHPPTIQSFPLCSSDGHAESVDNKVSTEKKNMGHTIDSAYSSLTRVLSETDSAKVEQSRFCHECGTQYPVAVAKFCCYCGMRRIAI